MKVNTTSISAAAMLAGLRTLAGHNELSFPMTWLQHLAYAVDFAVVLCLLVSAEVPGCQGDESRAADAPTGSMFETCGWSFCLRA